ncbi:MAG: CHAT domain-containing protein [Burkholderiales bacterium]|nr:CHAT domain-containing protein [Burkholderiales bacterium]
MLVALGAGAAHGADCPAESQDAALKLREEVQALSQAGRWADAAQRGRCLVNMATALFGPAHATTVNLKSELVTLLRRSGDASGAAALERELPRPAAASPDESAESALKQLIVESKALQDRGDFQGAGDRCIVARRIIDERKLPEGVLFAAVLNECGRAYEALGNYAMAEQRYRESDAMARRTDGPRNDQSSVALNNLGLLFWKTNQYEKAASALRESLEMQGADDPDRALTLVNLGLVEGALGHADAARRRYEEACALLLRHYGPDHPRLVEVYDNLAALEWRAGRLARAVQWQREANRVAELNIAAVIAIGSERQKLAYMRSFTDQIDASVSLGLAVPGDARHGALALDAVLQRKGRVLSALAASLDRVRRRSSAADAEVWAAFVRSRQAAAQAPVSGGASGGREQVEALLARGEGSDVAAEDLARNVDTGQVRRALGAGSALLEFVAYQPRAPAGPGPFAAGPPRYAAFLLKREGDLVWADIGARADVDRLVSDLRAGLANPRATYTRDIARNLHGVLFGKFERALKGVERLYVAPDGALNLVPIAALQDADGRAVLDRFVVATLSSGRDLVRSVVAKGGPAAARAAQGRSVVVANPDFGATSGASVRCGPFQPLRGTQGEGAAIASLLPGAQLVAGPGATETAVKSVQRPHVLHMATHGYFGPLANCASAAPAGGDGDAGAARDTDPLQRSGLVLAGANQLASGRDDGLLTSMEVTAMDLTGTDLVVLSACDSGLGDVVAGEGVFGLRRAFELAGARRQVISLWKVPDAETARLMRGFYAALKAGQDPARALARAQRELRDDPTGSTAAPFYWAAFFVSGDPRPFVP